MTVLYTYCWQNVESQIMTRVSWAVRREKPSFTVARSEKITAILGSYLVVVVAMRYASSLWPSNPTFGYRSKRSCHTSPLTCVPMLVPAVCGGRWLQTLQAPSLCVGGQHVSAMGVSQCAAGMTEKQKQPSAQCHLCKLKTRSCEATPVLPEHEWMEGSPLD